LGHGINVDITPLGSPEIRYRRLNNTAYVIRSSALRLGDLNKYIQFILLKWMINLLCLGGLCLASLGGQNTRYIKFNLQNLNMGVYINDCWVQNLL